MIEQESRSGWRQFEEDGTPVMNHEPSGKIGIGLTQITLYATPNTQSLPLGIIEENVPQGPNEFTAKIAPEEESKVYIDRLKSEWKYNLEIGVRHLLAKKVDSEGSDPSGIGDSRILENWYYSLAYYNGLARYGDNDPNNSKYNRTVDDQDWKWKSTYFFPYQECIYNIIAQLYPIPGERKPYFGPPIKVILPGPSAVASGAGRYLYLQADFCPYDWALYFSNGQVKIGDWGKKHELCNPGKKILCTNVSVNIVSFGRPTQPLTNPISGPSSCVVVN